MISFIQGKDVSSILVITILTQKYEEVEAIYKERYGDEWMRYEEEIVDSLIHEG